MLSKNIARSWLVAIGVVLFFCHRSCAQQVDLSLTSMWDDDDQSDCTASMDALNPNPTYNGSDECTPATFTDWTYDWDGDITGDNTQQTVNLDISEDSSSSYDKTATCTAMPEFVDSVGNTVDGDQNDYSASFTVCNLSYETDNHVPNTSDTTRNQLGVGETVSMYILPSDVQASWDVSGGNGSVNKSYANSPTYQAGDYATTETVTATLDSGDEDYESFQLITPTTVTLSEDNNMAITRVSAPNLTISFWNHIYIGPAYVSFEGIETLEQTCYATTSGYFDFDSGETHIPGTQGNPGTSTVDSTNGTEMLVEDHTTSTTQGHPTTYEYEESDGTSIYWAGTFQWAIPWVYSVVNDSDNPYSITTVNQNATLTVPGLSSGNSGTLQLSKAGASDSVSTN